MDSNVSKSTFSHKFFKLRFIKGDLTISVKNLLKKYLLQTLDLHRHRSNILLDLEYISTILERKLFLLDSGYRQLSSKNKINQILSKPQVTPIVYSCPIAFSLAPYLQLSPQIIADNLVNLLTLNGDNAISESCLTFYTEVVTPGWINFYLDSKSIANWLEQSLIFLEEKAPLDRDLSQVYQLQKTPDNLFPIQYVHARCCSLLRLGERENLITLKKDNFGNVAWHLEQPQKISWLDELKNLWHTQESEYKLLRQLFVVTDSFTDKSDKWAKIALDLSENSEIFYAECRFLGDVKFNEPQKAIARLGLIALTQYWLQKILIEKLNVAAPTEL